MFAFRLNKFEWILYIRKEKKTRKVAENERH